MATDAIHLDDAALVLAVQHGDSEAFAALFERHHDHVRRVCARRLNNPIEADEVAQAAFVRAFERIHQCTGERRFGAWVQVIASRLCSDTWRGSLRTISLDAALAGEPAPGPDECEEAVLRAEQAAAVRQALDTLPPRQRQVIVARDIDGRRPGEIAGALAVSVGAVDSLLLRARRRMMLAYRASSPEQGAASASATAASATAGSAAAGPFGRAVESLTGLFNAGVANVASALGLAPPGGVPRVVGGVVAGALLLAPLAVVEDRHRPVPDVVAPAAGLPGGGGGLDLGSALPVPPPPALPPSPPSVGPDGAAAPAGAGLAAAAPAGPEAMVEGAPPAAAPRSPLPPVVAEVPAAVAEVSAVVAEIEGAVTAAVHDVGSRLPRPLRPPRIR
ncbi:MAG: RNA polymerase sigma factor [Actinobacteria bacterium]|nr:RNA polymerase sigma factor [Actinomycetota bacterium]MBW3649159.1 RNA polymerase sigma factor [Actinomycetota bacterium]